ncbi:lipopolysaccharide biosynthesis protein [Streptomyces litchfieldiae]|uniref:Lipopolysaccharide biosynthesis protein n=1 Tax=Streptomyces litchfieldiae TaxID=3075543 RepID=A0ABU2MKH4_9ACTN|nr:lipopolysaccharide biosynthesis protein [Streptomyces sp. DSM 44938]MDT0342108.1 lipopolysaccharide biosynthesis protein [Streptomyces sp. DSM 44938]
MRYLPALCVLLGLLAGAAHALLTDREYAATGTLAATAAGGGDPLGFAQAYGRLAADDAVRRAAEPGTRVRAVTSPEAPVIEITGTGPSPRDAATTANAVARALIDHAERAADATGAKLVRLTEALPPTTPVTPVPWISLATGTCAGTAAATAALLATPPPARRRLPAQPTPARTDAAAAVVQ